MNSGSITIYDVYMRTINSINHLRMHITHSYLFLSVDYTVTTCDKRVVWQCIITIIVHPATVAVEIYIFI